MKHGFLKAALASVVAAGFLAGCATTVDWGTPLGHYRYSYDSRPVVTVPADTHDSYYYEPPATYTAPAVTYYHRDDDD